MNLPLIADEHRYELFNQIIQDGNYSSLYFLVDENTHLHCLPILFEQLEGFDSVDLIEIEAGEASKSIETCTQIWQTLYEYGADRKSLIINIGGGVITDIGGFIASTFMRGIDFIQVPTSLLGMVDAAIGGKTGIDLQHIKNAVGSFATPQAILIDPIFLETLPERERKAGLAEMLKHGLIADKAHYDFLVQQLQEDANWIPSEKEIIDSIRIKEKIVRADPMEKGLRKVLNFGHTIGHALESHAMEKGLDLIHGEAVILGMLAEIDLSVKYAGLDAETAVQIQSDLCSIYPKLDTKIPPVQELLPWLLKDKKKAGTSLNFSLLKKLGEACYDQAVPLDDLLL